MLIITNLFKKENIIRAQRGSKAFKQKNKRNADFSTFLLTLKNAGDRNRTGTVLLRQDFKSCASASSATPAYKPRPPNLSFNEQNLMGGGGFEPPKQFAADLQSVPFGHSGIHPFICQNFS